MPLLKYRCKACGALFDALVSYQDAGSVTCEACAGPVERAYEGACLFGMSGSSAGRGAGCAGDCGNCGGCGTHTHGAGCQCGAH